MKSLRYLLLLILILNMLIISVSAADTQIDGLNITSNYTQALDDAQNQNKSVMLIFSQDNCYYCDLFDEDVLGSDEVQDKLNEDFIVADVDISKESVIAGQYQIYGTPTTVILDSDGNEVSRIEGYVSAEEFLDELKEI